MKLLISACLLGIPCRYDGASKPQSWAEKLAERHELKVQNRTKWVMPVQLFVSVTRFIVQYRITKLLESALFYKLPAIRFHILTPFLVGKLVVLPPFRGAILPFEKNAEDFRIFFKKFFEQQNTPVRKARTDV